MFNLERFLGIGEPAVGYSVQLRAFSAPFFPKYDSQRINELNFGGKILLPNSCLDNLIRRHIQWPMLFKLTNLDPVRQKCTHAGVLEFLAEEGKCYLPSWIMEQLGLIEGELISVEYRSLPPATYAKFKPMSTDFYQVTNPRAMLEVELRKFACLSKGDVIAVQYNEQIFEFKVMDLKPQGAVTIIECDINIEFDTAEGYVEPEKPLAGGATAATVGAKGVDKKADATAVPEEKKTTFKPFSGTGYRLDGKKGRTTSTSGIGTGLHQPSTKPSVSQQQSTSSSTMKAQAEVETVPNGLTAAEYALLRTPIVVDEDYKPGHLQFVRTEYKSRAALEEQMKKANGDDVDGTKLFAGKGRTIR